MVLAIVISQIPMPETRAVEAKEMTEEEMQVDDKSAHVVTFSMNSGTFKGNYNGYGFQNKTPVLIIDDGEKISRFPDDKYASYSGYKTEADTWYTDKECLTKYDADSSVTSSITLYKKWYNITSDGVTLAAEGFHISADGTVLYRYDGEDTLVKIPATVTTIADGAFGGLDQEVRGIMLPAGISNIGENVFEGMSDGRIVYLYDSDTEASKKFGKQLASQYEQLVYSGYLDPNKTEQIAGIRYLGDIPQEEEAETPERARAAVPRRARAAAGTDGADLPDNDSADDTMQSSDGDNTGSDNDPTDNDNEPSESGGADISESEEAGNTKPSEEDGTKPTENGGESESSTGIVVEPDEKCTVIFDTGISGVGGEQRKVPRGETISESVSINSEQSRILRKDTYQIVQDDGKQEIVYTFKGWYKDNACTAEWDFSEDRIEKENVTLYAKWDRQTRSYFYVTYSATQGNEGAADIPGRQKLYGDQNLEKPANTPAMANKTFKGWYTGASGGTEYTSWGKPVTADMTLYAHFEEKTETKKPETKTNTVVFNMNGGGFTGNYNGSAYTNATSLTSKITAGKKISTVYPEGSDGTSGAFQYSGYTTDTNWYRDKECLDVYGSDTVPDSDITLYKKWYHTSSGFTMDASGNVLYRYSGGAEDVSVPDSVTVIGSDAFASVGGISSIILPDNIAEVKENAFSGVSKMSKDIVITGKTEKAQNMAKKLADQYTRLVYEGADDENDSSVVVSREATGSIRLGATLSGSAGTTGNSTAAAVPENTNKPGTIVLGANSTGAPAPAGVQTTAVTQPEAGSQKEAAGPSTITSVQQSSSDSSAPAPAAVQGAKTTQRQNVTSASAPKSTQHIKDSTPRTGDPLQYRMLIACAMFSVGVLLILTGNGKKRRLSAS